MQRIFFLVFFLPGVLLRAQSLGSRVGARFSFQEVQLFTDSAAGAISLPGWHPYSFDQGGGFAGGLNRYGLRALTECMFGGGTNSPVGSMRWGGVVLGDGLYHQATAQVSIVRHLNERFRLGTGIGFSYVGMAGYGSRWMPVGSVTAGGMIGARMVWGLCWDNPQQLMSQKAWLSQSPMRIRLGVAQALSMRLSLYGGVEWEPGAGNGTMVRLSYRLHSDWRVDLATGRRPDQLLLGVHRRVKQGWMVLSFSQEMSLGSSIYVGYSWRARKGERR